MSEAFICDAVRTPIGRCGGLLSSVRADDLAAVPLTGLFGKLLSRRAGANGPAPSVTAGNAIVLERA